MSFLGYRSWLGALNGYVLQWTGWRLAKVLRNGNAPSWRLVRMPPGTGWYRS